MRPFIHVNCAMSADGKIAGPDRKQVRISSHEDKQRVKGLRKQYNSILVGVGTVIADNPHLTVKGLSFEENPIRVVIDPHGRTPDDSLVLDEDAPTIILTDSDCTRTWDDVLTIRCGSPFDLEYAMNSLAEMGIENILVEGGGETIASFFKAQMVDRYTVYVGNIIIGGRTAPTPADGGDWIATGGIALRLIDVEVLGDGAVFTYIPEYK